MLAGQGVLTFHAASRMSTPSLQTNLIFLLSGQFRASRGWPAKKQAFSSHNKPAGCFKTGQPMPAQLPRPPGRTESSSAALQAQKDTRTNGRMLEPHKIDARIRSEPLRLSLASACALLRGPPRSTDRPPPTALCQLSRAPASSVCRCVFRRTTVRTNTLGFAFRFSRRLSQYYLKKYKTFD